MTIDNNRDSAITSIYSPSTAPDLHAEYESLRAECPVVHSDDFGGFWSLMKYGDASKAIRDWKTYESGQPFVEYPSPNRPIPISTNPPEHTFYRKFLNHYFVADKVAAIRPDIERIVSEQLDPLIVAGGGDIYRDVARLVPPRVLARLLGLSADGWTSLAATLAEADALRHDVKAFGARQATLWDQAVNDLLSNRKRSPRDPEHDIMSGILALEPEGRPISEEEAKSIATQLFAAGADTTSSAMGSLAHYLATHRDEQEHLRSKPEGLPAAIEEVLRLGPPIHQTVRRTTKPAMVRGVDIEEGQLVAINVASANRDEEQFRCPHEVDLHRTRNPHLTFGFGPHMCVGAPVAREELRIFGEQLLARTDAFSLVRPAVSAGRALRTGWVSMEIEAHR